MTLKIRLLLLLTLLMLAGIVVSAQEDDGETAVDLDLYSEIPQSRAADGAFILGDPDAPVTVIEFADYLCPHCQDYHATVAEFIDEYVATGQAKLEYRFFPIIDQQLSPYIAAITECAWDQDAFWPTYEFIYEQARQRAIGADILDVTVEALALDGEAMEVCLETADQYLTDQTLASELDVTGTPAIRVRVGEGPAGALVVDGRELTGGGVPLEVLAEFVESDAPEDMVTYALGPQLLNADYLQDMSIITADPCGAPCWNNITPGETSWAAALEIVESDDNLDDVQIQTDGSNDRVGAVWAQVDGDLCCQMFSDDTGEIVDFVILQTAPELTFGEIIDVYEEPNFLLGDAFTSNQALISVFYADVPMLVYVFVEGEQGKISTDSPILGMAYMTEDLFAELVETSPELAEWDDFDTFDAYFGDEAEVED